MIEPVKNQESISTANGEANLAAPSGVEIVPSVEQEQINQNVVQENPVDATAIQTQLAQTDDQAASADDQEEITEEFSDKIDSASTSYTQKAKDIIKEYSSQPFKEEEESSALEVDYMKNRFGVNLVDEESKK